MKSKKQRGKAHLPKETRKELLIHEEIFQDSFKGQKESMFMVKVP